MFGAPEVLWRNVNKSTIKTLRGLSPGQYDIRLGKRGEIAEFFAGLPRVEDGGLGGYNVLVPLEPVIGPVDVAPTSLTVSYLGEDSERADWRIPSQRPGTAYPLWDEGTGLQTDTVPGTDFVIIARDFEGRFHARWLSPERVAALPAEMVVKLEKRSVGVSRVTTKDWPKVAAVMGIEGGQQAVETERRDAPDPTTGPSGEPYRVENEEIKLKQPDPFSVDPDVLDRGILGHRQTQNAFASFLEEKGLVPLSPRVGIDPMFDLAWLEGEVLYVAEIKSITSANQEKQLRLALGQVLRYAQRLRSSHEDVRAVIVTERQPDDETWIELCEQLRVRLMWPGSFSVETEGIPA